MATEKRLIDANCIPYQKSGFPKGDGFDSRLDWAFREDIDKLPTVDAVEVVHGRWITDKVEAFCPLTGNPYPLDVLQCSACGGYFDVSEARNYCSNCGAKMDGDPHA